MKYEEYLINFVKAYVPFGGELLISSEGENKSLISIADLDEDGLAEIIAAYKWRDEAHVMVLKSYYNIWYVAANIRGRGYDVNYLKVAPVVKKSSKDIIIGWQFGAIWSKLSIYQWTPKGIVGLTNQDIYYSKIEVEDMESVGGLDGKVEIALWSHDTGDAYKIEVFKWQDGKLVPAPEVYPYYFKRVVAFYKGKVQEIPDAAFYWYYLANALLKAEILEDALVSIKKAISLNSDYPEKETLLKLEEEILQKLNRRETCNKDHREIKLYPASIKTVTGTKWGYIDNKGSFLIAPLFESAGDFNDKGLAVVETNDKYGLIDVSGRYILEPKYDTINNFSEGRAVVIDSEGFKVIDESGREITSKAYTYISNYVNGRAVFSVDLGDGNWLYGFLDLQGKEVIPAIYKSASDFNDGKAVVKANEGEYKLISLGGEVLNTYKYSFVGNLGDGLMPFRESDESKYGFIYENGSVAIPPQYTWAQSFQDGRAVVNLGEDITNKYGLINVSGNFVIKPLYNDIQILGEKRVAVGEGIDKDKPYMGSIYAIADIDGNFLTDFIYSKVEEYKNGLASVYDNKNTFFIDRSGKAAKGFPVVKGSGVLTLIGDIIKGDIDLRTFYMNKNGTLIYKQNTIIPLNTIYSIIEEKYKPNKDYLVYYPKVVGMEDKTAENSVNERLKEMSRVVKIMEDEQLQYSYTGDFSIEFFRKNLLVLELNGYEYPFGAAHGMPSKLYPHIDLVSGRFYELKDLFKQESDYVKILSSIIENQIKNNEEYSYVWIDEYKGIKEDQSFYVDGDALYIYFYPYEIAPYAAGFPTFRIEYEEIKDIINTNGEFWRAFN